MGRAPVVLAATLAMSAGACGRIGFDTSFDAATGDALSYPQQVLASGPFAYYRLDESTGPTAHDASGNGNDAFYGTTGGTITYQLPGALVGDSDPAVEILGNGDAAVSFDQVAPTWSGNFTIEAFVNPMGMPPPTYADDLLLCEDYLVNGFRTGWDQSFHLQFWTTQSGASTTVATTVTLDTTQWNHVVFVRSGAEVAIYLDGVVVADDLAVTYLSPDATADCGFGAFHGMESQADFDEVAIYDRALPATEIAEHFAAAR